MKEYMIYDKLFIHKRNDMYLVVSRTPPAWIITNFDGYRIISALPERGNFTAETIAELIKIDISKIIQFLDLLYSAQIVVEKGQHIEQPDRTPSINGAYIEVTSECNLRCMHCYVGAGEKENSNVLTKDEIMQVVEQIPIGGEIGISGGEPLLRPDCMEIIEEIVGRGYRCALLTNGLLITDEYAKKLADLRVTVQVSLEGASAKIHDSIRGVGTFDRTIKSILSFLKYSDRMRISFTPTKRNYKDFTNLVGLIKKMGIPSLHICTYTPQGRGKKNCEQLLMEQGELIEFQKEVEKASKTMEIMGNLPETLDLLRVGYLWDKCPLGGSIHVGYDGSIYPCEIAANQKMIIGNVRDMALGEALNSEKARMFIDNSRERIEKIEECLECEWKHFCGGGCMVLSLSENDEINSKDYLCGCRKFWLETLIWEKVCI